MVQIMYNHESSSNTMDILINNTITVPTIHQPFVVFSPLRAEGLAVEIKDLQGQLADYNMVKC